METNELLEVGKKLIENWTESSNSPEEYRLDFWVKPENLNRVVQQLVENRWGYLITITGMDIPPVMNDENVESQPGMLEALYHFANDAAIITFRVKVPYTNPKIDSICNLIPSATIYEREVIELFGFDLINTPSTERLVLPDSWPKGVYPSRKSFTALPNQETENKELTNE
ncbi:MAG TPA: NADH-quinone oxidoreductase subunit C [Anaerolineaceae bacterium]|nr:NADH-quinone oxidoreductase subunit C [Anaerolineaceae bacterium]